MLKFSNKVIICGELIYNEIHNTGDCLELRNRIN